MLKRSIFLSLIFFSGLTFAQEETLEDIFKVDYDTPLTLEIEKLEQDTTQQIVEPKKKKKKKVFFGIKTRKGFTKNVIRNQVVFELFYMLKEYSDPPKYARDFYWYDYKKRKIMNSLRVPDNRRVGVLHGPYKKMLGDQVIEQGWFYKGMKHRRWVTLNRHDILQDKKYWWRGWPQESRISYWDFEKTKLKEVIPVHYGEKDGEYWVFHTDGSVAVRGTYKHGYRVGLWREYFDDRRIKREMIYPDNPFDFDKDPYIVREWDKKGTLIYDRTKTSARSSR
jgi:antitoxin component YwqK of YwqJK toxin-antitoxin module